MFTCIIRFVRQRDYQQAFVVITIWRSDATGNRSESARTKAVLSLTWSPCRRSAFMAGPKCLETSTDEKATQNVCLIGNGTSLELLFWSLERVFCNPSFVATNLSPKKLYKTRFRLWDAAVRTIVREFWCRERRHSISQAVRKLLDRTFARYRRCGRLQWPFRIGEMSSTTHEIGNCLLGCCNRAGRWETDQLEDNVN